MPHARSTLPATGLHRTETLTSANVDASATAIGKRESVLSLSSCARTLGGVGASSSARTTQRPGGPEPVRASANPAGGSPTVAESKLHRVVPDPCGTPGLEAESTLTQLAALGVAVATAGIA